MFYFVEKNVLWGINWPLQHKGPASLPVPGFVDLMHVSSKLLLSRLTEGLYHRVKHLTCSPSF